MSNVRHVVGFSGGIDSQACALWVRQRYPAEDIILLNSQAGRNEHPITTSFVQWYADTIHPVTEVVPLIRDLGTRGTKEGATKERRDEFSDDEELTFDRLAYVKGRFPSRKAQFCTEHLKLAPQKRWCDENLLAKGIDYIRYAGVRREEGLRGADRQDAEKLLGAGCQTTRRDNRSRAEIPDSEWDDYFDCEIHYPVAAWTKEQCFAYVLEHDRFYNPLYKMGFGRVGCAPCINSGKDDIREWAARFPEMIDKIREWEQRVGRTFFAPCVPPGRAYRHAMKTWVAEWTERTTGPDGKAKRSVKKGAPPKPQAPINFIDDVVRWSKTSRGGKQFNLPMVEAEAALRVCSSRYGLCE